jgi:hypothetical protein
MQTQAREHGFPGTRAVLDELARLRKENARLRNHISGGIRQHIYEATHGDPPRRRSLPGSAEKWEGYLLGVEEAAVAAEAFAMAMDARTT